MPLSDKGKNNSSENSASELEEHFQFENLLGELSAKLVNLPLESIDNAIDESIKILADFFDADRCHIGMLIPHEDKIETVYYYANDNVVIPKTTSIGVSSFSYVHSSIKNEKQTLDVLRSFNHLL